MEYVANYELQTELSVVADDLILNIAHPDNRYRARIQNITRQDYETPFLLSLHLYFDTPSLDDAKDIADGYLVECMNMLAFTTGSTFRLHRIRQIVDATPEPKGMHSVLMWANSTENEDPQPFLREETVATIQRLLEYEVPAAIKRAIRWYRLGINASAPDDQFTYFWFAVEIIAEHQKSSEKVPDRCPRCRSPLYCETCDDHPSHKPYAKQAIRALMKAADDQCDDETVDLLDKTRNSLMHGSTLEEIEKALPDPHEQIVDVLGRLVWKSLIHQFPKELFDGSLVMGYPSTYVHRKLHGIAHVQTVVPKDENGDFDLNFKGMKVELVTGPPQSALPTVIQMCCENYEHLRELSYGKGEHQDILQRILERVEQQDDVVQVLMLSTDMAFIRDLLKSGAKEEWLEIFRGVLEEQSDK